MSPPVASRKSPLDGLIHHWCRLGGDGGGASQHRRSRRDGSIEVSEGANGHYHRYERVRTYRGAATLCGTTHKTLRRVIEARSAEDVEVQRQPRTVVRNIDGVAGLVAQWVRATDGRISAKRLRPAARAAGYGGSARNFPSGGGRGQGPVAPPAAGVPAVGAGHRGAPGDRLDARTCGSTTCCRRGRCESSTTCSAASAAGHSWPPPRPSTPALDDSSSAGGLLRISPPELDHIFVEDQRTATFEVGDDVRTSAGGQRQIHRSGLAVGLGVGLVDVGVAIDE
jgi:hypothetical protein